MDDTVSVIIPNHNGSATLCKCLEAAFASRYPNFEVIVADDCSSDNSVEIIREFPCRLVRLEQRSGASNARNAGAALSSGGILFFTDADCILMEDTLSEAVNSLARNKGAVVGGTYTEIPFDDHFFSTFQSVFVNYSETKRRTPDYLATHAMAIDRRLFLKSGLFNEDFLPILEDVEFSHRLRRAGCSLVMNPRIVVRHIFNFTLLKSLRNGFRKSMFWTLYSISNGDVLADSGTASKELKINVASFFVCSIAAFLFLHSGSKTLLVLFILVLGINLWSSRGLISAFYRAKGSLFAACATLYYTLLYPLAVGSGAIAGAIRYIFAPAK